MILGIRCSNNDFTFVTLSGSRSTPTIEDKKSATFPRGYSRSNMLKWFYQEIDDYINNNQSIDKIVIKGAEPMAQKGGAYSERVENEAMAILVAAIRGIDILRKVKPTIAKDLGLRGSAKALEADLDTSNIADFSSLSDKEKESLLAALSEM